MSKAVVYCKSVFDGTHDSPKPVKKGYKLLTSKNILNGILDKENAYYISENDYKAINKRSQIKQWDILFSMIGTVGNVCLVTDSNIDFAIKNMGVFSCGDELKAKWLYFFLKSPYAKKLMNNYLNGAVQKFLPLEWLRNLEIPDYDFEKDNIIQFLWNIDSKISNNTAICSDLESMAKLIYDYWFVQFDFPDENGRPYKSSGGKMIWNEKLKREIPEGWKQGFLSSFGEIVGGGTPSTENKAFYTKDGIAWATPKDLADRSFKYFVHGERDITKEGLSKSSAVLMPKGTVLMTSRAPIGYLAIATESVCTNQGFKSIIPKEEFGSEFVFYTLQLLMPYIKRYGVGSTFAEVSKQDLSEIKTVIPKIDILLKFKELMYPITEKWKLIESENQQLASLRDFLLPMLMNGQVKVKS